MFDLVQFQRIPVSLTRAEYLGTQSLEALGASKAVKRIGGGNMKSVGALRVLLGESTSP